MTEKIDLHRHLGGSIRPETVWKIIQMQPDLRSLASSVDELYDIMTFRNDKNFKFQNFLEKFNVLNHITWDEEAINLTIKQVVEDIAQEDISYCELRFSISKYLSHLSWDEQEACLFVLDRIAHWGHLYDVEIGPVLSIKYESPKIEAKRMSKLINHWRIAEQLVGLDFVGDEAFFNSKIDYIAGIYRYWRMCGKGLLIHAGETQGAANVKEAITRLHVNRIAHGIAAADHDDILKLAKDNNVAFDVSVTSNVITGVIKDYKQHPVKTILEKEAIITIGTDDPVTFDTTLNKEYCTLASILEVNESDPIIEDVKSNSCLHALVPVQ